MTRDELRDNFHNEQGIKWENSQGEPDIDYVEWLEDKVIQSETLKKFNGIISEHKTLDPDIQQLINKHFWELLK